MKLALLLILLFSTSSAECIKKQLKVAVIDTGYGFNKEYKDAPLCEHGHKDFTKDDWGVHTLSFFGVPPDLIGHGTNIVGVINNYAKRSNLDYCLVILKYYSNNQTDKQNLESSIKAIKYATELNVDFINYSGGGPGYNDEEKQAVKEFLDQGGQLIAAAGNDGKELGTFWGVDYYPAMYDKRIVVVGNLDKQGVKSKLSNYGKYVNRWEVGENITSYGITLTGTSMSAAVATGKIMANIENKCNLEKNKLHKP